MAGDRSCISISSDETWAILATLRNGKILRTEKENLIILAPVSFDAFPVTGDVLSEGGGVRG